MLILQLLQLKKHPFFRPDFDPPNSTPLKTCTPTFMTLSKYFNPKTTPQNLSKVDWNMLFWLLPLKPWLFSIGTPPTRPLKTVDFTTFLTFQQHFNNFTSTFYKESWKQEEQMETGLTKTTPSRHLLTPIVYRPLEWPYFWKGPLPTNLRPTFVTSYPFDDSSEM